MDRVKLEKLITENMKSIFGFALTRLGNVKEAECLASDILYEVIRSAPNLKDEERFYGFMWKVAENVYADYLRKKSKRARHTVQLEDSFADESESALDQILKKEEINLLRRELSLLSRQYRDVTVLYYIENLSCSEIAKRLQTSTEMVKYYLFRARKIIREGMNMERLYGEKSYRPNIFEIDFWGTNAGDDFEYRDFERRKIKGNILLAAYYSPVSIQEISIEHGVALPYLEDEIKLLVDRQYLVCNNGKYLTNIPIFTLDCTKAIDEKLREQIGKSAQRIAAVTDDFNTRFGNRFADINLARWQKLLLCLHYSLVDTENDFVRNYGELPQDGPYSLVNGGGGRGIVWGRSTENVVGDKKPRGIQGIYNGCPSSDQRGSVIAMNFRQTLNAQEFEGKMVDPIVCTAVGCYEYLPDDWKKTLDDLHYSQDGKANFAVWSYKEYGELRQMLGECISVASDLNRKTTELAASITADLAPRHIRKSAEYVGAVVYRFYSADKLVEKLYEMNWVAAVGDAESLRFVLSRIKASPRNIRTWNQARGSLVIRLFCQPRTSSPDATASGLFLFFLPVRESRKEAFRVSRSRACPRRAPYRFETLCPQRMPSAIRNAPTRPASFPTLCTAPIPPPPSPGMNIKFLEKFPPPRPPSAQKSIDKSGFS